MSFHPNLEACDPRQCISSRILKCNRIISGIFRQHLLPYKITGSQLSILFILAKGGDKSQQELADRLFLEKSTISRNMQRLFKGHYIDRKSPRIISITDQGRDFLEEVVPSWDKAMAEAQARLTSQGDEALTVLLTQLTS